ncbi:GNAT family N-acetyltransferase [Piscirickettsia litoralis]|uniref:GNAT family N-acetyltransferase n=1 Tax=Piscirickettsia litoralis TaxID=1891921 RepID=A0ABX3A1R5_9GAMM|nr:GNAT family N-acetyltransferase [Piscirickettsia litoralis]ODN42763.1 GNAT family N-acetyltransferase [Piscirickettsia litoralis]
MDNYVISTMTEAEVQIAIDWARKEGWNPGLNDAKCFYLSDSHGFFKGELDGEIIAVGSAVIYDSHFAFCGLYIVKEEFRGKNYGFPLTKARLDYVGDRLVGLDGVLEKISTYEKIGYKNVYCNARFELLEPIKQEIPENSNIINIAKVPLQQLLDYDRECFPAYREQFLKFWINQAGAFSYAYMDNNQLQGYIVMRPCYQGYKIGPLFADDFDQAEALFLAACSQAESFPIYLDIPLPNDAAKKLVDKYKMKQVFATNRMYKNGQPDINLNKVFGITTFELG